MLLRGDACTIRGFGERNNAVGYLGDELGGILGCFGASGPTVCNVNRRVTSQNDEPTE